MSNELIFLLTTFLDLAFVLVFFRLGRRGLLASVIVNVILVSTFGGKLISVFGLVTNTANVFYSAIFLAVNMMVERFDRREGLKAVWAGFGALVIFMVMGQFVVLTKGVGESEAVNQAIEVLFSLAPRIAFASMFAYLIAQHLNLFLFDFLKKMPFLRVGFRNIVSTLPAQLVDSILFFSLAFYGSINNQVLVQTIAVGFLLKTIIAILSAPFMLLSTKMQLTGSAPASVRLVTTKDRPAQNLEVDWLKIKIAKMLALIICTISILVMGGWLFDIPILTYVIEGLESMKFSTAISFFCTGVLLYFFIENHLGRRKYAGLVIPAMVMIIVFFMATLLVSVLFKLQFGIEELFVRDSSTTIVIGYAPGFPSIITMLNFLFISLSSLVTLGNFFEMSKRYLAVGTLIFLTGLSGLIGYLIQQPYLYFEFKGFSNGVALHTAFLFALVGITYITLGLSKRKL